MTIRRVIAGILLIVILIMIILPSVSIGTLLIEFNSKVDGSANHLYVTLGPILVHEAGMENHTGWKQISNQTISIDLLNPKETDDVMKATIHTGWYDVVAVHVASALLVNGSNETALNLSSERYEVPILFVLKTLSEKSLIIQLDANVQEAAYTGILELEFNATAA